MRNRNMVTHFIYSIVATIAIDTQLLYLLMLVKAPKYRALLSLIHYSAAMLAFDNAFAF